MKYCTRCAAPLADADACCARCGAWQPLAPAAPVYSAPVYVPPTWAAAPAQPKTPPEPPAHPVGAVGTFLWGLLLSMVANPVGTPLAMAGAGIAASCTARNARGDTRARLRTSKLLCIAASVVDACSVVAVIALIVYAASQYGGGENLLNSLLQSLSGAE